MIKNNTHQIEIGRGNVRYNTNIYTKTEEEKMKFYEEIQKIIYELRDTHDNIIIMGDWNTRIGKD